MTTTSTPTPPSTFRFIDDWKAIQPADVEAIQAFWRREGAITDQSQMDERVRQVVMHALDADGEVAGVCTAQPMSPPQLGQPVYYWRTFVGAKWRNTALVMRLLKRSCVQLEAYAHANDYPCIGILLEMENTRFREKGRMAAWWNPAFVYIGRSQRGLDTRVLYFKGAKLKPAT